MFILLIKTKFSFFFIIQFIHEHLFLKQGLYHHPISSSIPLQYPPPTPITHTFHPLLFFLQLGLGGCLDLTLSYILLEFKILIK